MLRDADEDVGTDKESRLIKEEAARMMERWRSMRRRESGQYGSSESQDQRDRSARARRTDSGTERKVLFKDILRSPPVKSRQQKEEELAAMRRQMERLASKIMQLESGKKWKHKGNEKQFQFATEVRGIMVDNLRVALEEKSWSNLFVN